MLGPDQLFLSLPQWHAVRPVMLGELLLRVVEEFAKIDFTLEDNRRDALVALLTSNGFIIGPEIDYKQRCRCARDTRRQ